MKTIHAMVVTVQKLPLCSTLQSIVAYQLCKAHTVETFLFIAEP